VATHDEIEALVLEEATRILNRTLVLTEVDGLCGADVVTRVVDPPVLATVIEGPSTVIRWTDDTWCDPIFHVELLGGRVEVADLEQPWIYGTARSTAGDIEQARFEIVQDPPST
jgi:hypothetical protein